MPRYIDADRFNSFGYDTKGYDFKSFDAGVECILKMIDDAPTVEPADIIQSQWISTKKWFPLHKQPILMVFSKNYVAGYYNDNEDMWFAYDNNGWVSETDMPLYWIPLPEMPVPQEED
jgi:hypothetical protein